MTYVLEGILKWTDDTAAKLTAARSRIGELERALSTISPEAGRAASGLSGLAAAGAALGPAGLAIAGLAAAMAATAAALAATVVGVHHLADSAQELDNLRQKAGLTAGDLQGLIAGFKEARVAPEALTQGLRFLNNAIANNDPALKKLGITTRDTKQAFLELSDVFAAHADGPNKVAYAIQLLGRQGQDLIPVLNKGGDALQAMIDRAAALGIVFGKDNMAALLQADHQFSELTARVEGLKTQMLLLATPAVTDAIAKLNELLGVFLQIPEKIDKAEHAVRGLIAALPGGKGVAEWLALQAAIDKALKKLEDYYKAQEDAAAKAKSKPAMPPPPPPSGAADKPFGPAIPEDIQKRLDVMERLNGILHLDAAAWDEAYLSLKKFDDQAADEEALKQLRRGDKNDPFPNGPSLDVLGWKAKLSDALTAWRSTVAGMLDVGKLLQEGLGALVQGLGSAFAQVMEGLFSRTQTLGSAVRTILAGIGQAVVQLISRFAALMAAIGILNVIGGFFGMPGLGTIAAKAGGLRSAAPSGGPAGAAPSSAGPAIAVHVYGFDQKSIADHYRAYDGQLRIAEERQRVRSAA